MPKPLHTDENPFVSAQQRDVAIIKQHLAGHDISCQPLWFRDRGRTFMTYAGAIAIELAFRNAVKQLIGE